MCFSSSKSLFRGGKDAGWIVSADSVGYGYSKTLKRHFENIIRMFSSYQILCLSIPART